MNIKEIKSFKDFLLSMLSDGDQISSKRVNGTLCIVSGLLMAFTAIVLAICLGKDIPKEASVILIAVFSTGLGLLGVGALVEVLKK